MRIISGPEAFQSTPGIAAGRIGQVVRLPQSRHVSIHARHCCRANQPMLPEAKQPGMFQSTPGIAAGRIPASPPTPPQRDCFNPRPALLPGESGLKTRNECRQLVSIHARHCCRANLAKSDSDKAKAKVSIHARHCCRANLKASTARVCASVFQSTPGIAAGRINGEHCERDKHALFQSTPGIAAGRIGRKPRGLDRGCLVSIHARHCCRANRPNVHAEPDRLQCFNPRPALLPGESTAPPCTAGINLVSIHARHCCRANHLGVT